MAGKYNERTLDLGWSRNGYDPEYLDDIDDEFDDDFEEDGEDDFNSAPRSVAMAVASFCNVVSDGYRLSDKMYKGQTVIFPTETCFQAGYEQYNALDFDALALYANAVTERKQAETGIDLVYYFQHAYPAQSKKPLLIGLIPSRGTSHAQLALWPQGCNHPFFVGFPLTECSQFDSDAFIEIGYVNELQWVDGVINIPNYRNAYFRQDSNNPSIWHYSDYWDYKTLDVEQLVEQVKKQCGGQK